MARRIELARKRGSGRETIARPIAGSVITVQILIKAIPVVRSAHSSERTMRGAVGAKQEPCQR